MKRGIVAAAIAAPILVCGWLASASAIYLAGAGKMELFVFPYTQWIAAARWWRYTPWTTVWVVVGAAVPSLVGAFVVLIIVRAVAGKDATQETLYGRTGWADQKGMERGGLRIRDRI